MSSRKKIRIGDLLVEHGVAAVVHGHDHLFAAEELDGVLCVARSSPPSCSPASPAIVPRNGPERPVLSGLGRRPNAREKARSKRAVGARYGARFEATRVKKNGVDGARLQPVRRVERLDLGRAALGRLGRERRAAPEPLARERAHARLGRDLGREQRARAPHHLERVARGRVARGLLRGLLLVGRAPELLCA